MVTSTLSRSPFGSAPILTVDDDRPGRTLLAQILRGHGFQVREASTGADALRMADQDTGVVLLDVNLPDSNGFHVCRLLKGDPATAAVPVLMVSGDAVRPEDRAHGLDGGADAYLTKPVDPEELVAQVRALLRVRQVEERAFAAQAVAEAERQRAFTMLESVGDAVFALDRDWRFVYANWRVLDRVRWPREEVLGQVLWDVFPEAVGTEFEHECRRAMAGRFAVAFEVYDPAAAAWLEVHVHPSEDGLFASARDVTDRKCAEELRAHLAANVERAEDPVGCQAADDTVIIPNRAAAFAPDDGLLRLALDNVPVGVWVTDLEGHTVSLNPAGRILRSDTARSGCGERGELRGWWHETGTPVEAGAWPAARATRGDTVRNEVIDLESPGGAWTTIRASAVPVRDADGAVLGAMTIAEDITDRLRLEAQYLQAQKMQLFGQLAGGVAHDFNNLLTVIVGCSDLALGGLVDGDPARGLVAEVKTAGERAAALTRQLLAFSREQVPAPAVLDLNAVVAETERMLRRIIGEDVRLTTALVPAVGRIEADPVQVEQVLMNLAVNARDAMPGGGRLTIETRDVELDVDYVQAHPGATPGRFVLLVVSDTGRGMTPDVQARIFEPFFTTKTVGAGTGLGLATVHAIVRQGGGHIEVDSQPGRGTTFKVYWPRVATPVDVGVSAPGIALDLRGAETVLVAEDDDGVRALTSRVLRSWGYTVLAANDGAAALRIGRDHGGPIHLLISDVVMPGMDGRQLAKDVLAAHPEARVLYLSGYPDDAIVRHGLVEAEVDFLRKPFCPAVLARKVREMLGAYCHGQPR